ncbi:MBL fold metallo-hydrolase [Eggerthella sinensis]|uniref:MBL fold metallo-hydrolase n=2 Tax=Eggerthella sinensis TaxID=242230 RepID=A0A3N0IR02_9ACTN|nr:MBL fold metallo-hydrolase [Eggerthella sinensis]RDB70204.1 MBL fold metallo-hydrolase [Eggerthella sinensis]RNM39414.1 MBL fold metallo-hydrolase [Eggerthella sinensis]
MACVQVHRDPDVFEVRVPFENISTNDTNCYIVRDGDDTLVVDTGAPSDEGFAILDAALAELGVDRARAAFFLTHLHLDHAGLVDRIALPGARLYVSPVDFEAVRASRAASSYDSARRAFVAEGVSPSDASGYARYAVEPRLFDASRLTLVPSCEGDAIDVGRYRFRVVETPGHTPGHLSLYEPQSRILFSGDHVLFVISPSIALFPDGADGLQAYLDSLDKVRRLACRRLFVSHGEPRDDFEARIDWLAAHHLERLDETRAIVRENPGLTGEEVIRAIRWNVPFDTWEAISFVQRWCIVTEGLVILNHLVDRRAIRREPDEAGIHRYF